MYWRIQAAWTCLDGTIPVFPGFTAWAHAVIACPAEPAPTEEHAFDGWVRSTGVNSAKPGLLPGNLVEYNLLAVAKSI